MPSSCMILPVFGHDLSQDAQPGLFLYLNPAAVILYDLQKGKLLFLSIIDI